jgi:hypothetical protein
MARLFVGCGPSRFVGMHRCRYAASHSKRRLASIGGIPARSCMRMRSPYIFTMVQGHRMRCVKRRPPIHDLHIASEGVGFLYPDSETKYQKMLCPALNKKARREGVQSKDKEMPKRQRQQAADNFLAWSVGLWERLTLERPNEILGITGTRQSPRKRIVIETSA